MKNTLSFNGLKYIAMALAICVLVVSVTVFALHSEKVYGFLADRGVAPYAIEIGDMNISKAGEYEAMAIGVVHPKTLYQYVYDKRIYQNDKGFNEIFH